MKNFILPLCMIVISLAVTVDGVATENYGKERMFFIEERILLKDLPQDTNDLRIWIPYPVSDKWQAISDFSARDGSPARSWSTSGEALDGKLTSLFTVSIVEDQEYGNRIIYIKGEQKALDGNNPGIILSYKVHRKEYSASGDSQSSYEALSLFLKPNRLVPINGEIKKLAEDITEGKDNSLEKVRAIYDYVIDELTYSKDDPNVCGIGSSLLTLQYKKGICTDYHSLFISLVRSLGIPAKFEIGYRIPEDKSEGMLNGYHCWAKFYIEGKGWMAVDVSEADKHPEKRDYFFGHIDENRFHLTTGRDINLVFARDINALPLNFFIYPYTEVNGKQFYHLDTKIFFKELKGGDEGELEL